eukprot:NODE_646_length_766_cov_441.317992_g581_i0.p1 GENE.NODE_646_length_766_cov_441.317992_g581_i0~~NODE_646_length_766_cov_441.317992_g581_i0.p1  ORF type:complete len:158 (-),score=25.54 NODE_646_length_766_cov_441.317992_g581_i0:268-741(-)
MPKVIADTESPSSSPEIEAPEPVAVMSPIKAQNVEFHSVHDGPIKDNCNHVWEGMRGDKAQCNEGEADIVIERLRKREEEALEYSRGDAEAQCGAEAEADDGCQWHNVRDVPVKDAAQSLWDSMRAKRPRSPQSEANADAVIARLRARKQEAVDQVV